MVALPSILTPLTHTCPRPTGNPCTEYRWRGIGLCSGKILLDDRLVLSSHTLALRLRPGARRPTPTHRPSRRGAHRDESV